MTELHKHCYNVLKKYKIDDKELDKLPIVSEEIWHLLKPIHALNPTKYFGGSYAKGTMINTSFDLDMLVYFPNSVSKSPQELVKLVESILNENLKTKRLGVAIQFSINGFDVDLIIGKYQDDKKEFVDLWNSITEKKMRSSLVVHINHVSEVEEIIKLMKIWRDKHKLNWHKLAMERSIVWALKDKPKNDFGECLKMIFLDIKSNIDTIDFLDPANSNNPIFVNDDERKRIKEIATQSYRDILEGKFSSILD